LKDLKFAHEIAPKETSVLYEISRVKKEYNKMKENEKLYLKRMFSPVKQKKKPSSNVYYSNNYSHDK
jgi:hypothetical protein